MLAEKIYKKLNHTTKTFRDLPKAFDNIDHNIFKHRLEYCEHRPR